MPCVPGPPSDPESPYQAAVVRPVAPGGGGGGSGGRANLSPTCRSSYNSWDLRLIDDALHGRQYTCVALPSRCSYNTARVSFPKIGVPSKHQRSPRKFWLAAACCGMLQAVG